LAAEARRSFIPIAANVYRDLGSTPQHRVFASLLRLGDRAGVAQKFMEA
jgi:hypothetical protein